MERLPWTPWGATQQMVELCDGIQVYSTASHGGFKVSDEMLEKMPHSLRNYGNAPVSPNADNTERFYNGRGWYEEDLEFQMVVYSFPELFPEVDKGKVAATLEQWYPVRYEKCITEKRVAAARQRATKFEKLIGYHRQHLFDHPAHGRALQRLYRTPDYRAMVKEREDAADMRKGKMYEGMGF